MVNKEQENEIQYEAEKTFCRRCMDYLTITVAAVIYAVAVSLFLDPNSLAPGGVTGIAIILNRITGLETGTWMFAVNIPILIIGMWKFGWRFILSTLYCTLAMSCMTNLLSPVGALTTDPLLAALVGGSLMAVSLGLVFRAGATSGGTDIIVKLLRLQFPHLKTGLLFLLTDAVIVTASAFVFQDIDTALYAGLVVFVNSILLDLVLYGRDGAKMFFIISDNHHVIVERLLKELDISATYISGQGAYSGVCKNVILCIVKKHLSPKLEEIVRQEDPKSFTIITSATEIYGEGYKNIFSEKKLTQQLVFLRADIPERYGYKLLSGEKRTRQRDVILRICYAAEMSLAQTQRALKKYEMPELYAKLPRDALLMIIFNERPGDIIEVNEILKEHGMEPLRTSGLQN